MENKEIITKIVDNISDIDVILNELKEEYKNNPDFKINNHSIDMTKDGKFKITIEVIKKIDKIR